MKIILDVPDSTMCIGAFFNYRRKADGGHNFTSTCCLIDCEKYEGVKIIDTENGDNNNLTYLVKSRSNEGQKGETNC